MNPEARQGAAGDPVQFYARFLIGSHGGDHVGFRLRQIALRLQHEESRGGPQRILFLLGVERFRRQLAAFVGGGDAGAILLQRKLGVADVNANLVLELLKAQLGLAIFQLRAHMISLRRSITDGDAHGDAGAFIGRRAVKQISQSAAEARGWSTDGNAAKDGVKRSAKQRRIGHAGQAGALRADHLDRRERTDLDLFAIVGKSLVGQAERALFYFDILVGVYEVPINILDLGDRSFDLLAKRRFGNLAVIARDTD